MAECSARCHQYLSVPLDYLELQTDDTPLAHWLMFSSPSRETVSISTEHAESVPHMKDFSCTHDGCTSSHIRHQHEAEFGL